ncbi:MAG: hypothetical protein V1709_07965 [Planctomycetota bacterium]
MVTNRPIPYIIKPKDIPKVLEHFTDLAGLNSNNIPNAYPFKDTFNYYFENKSNWPQNNPPEYVRQTVSDISPLMLFYERIKKYKPIKRLLKNNFIPSFLFEGMVASNYIRRRYLVRWSSLLGEDPPDIIVGNPKNKIIVDIECKIKDNTILTKDLDESVESMFDSLSKGLQSLKNRKEPNHMAVVAIHSSKDLYLEKWLQDADVRKRLKSRLSNNEYKIISGIIFSGGDKVVEIQPGVKDYITKLVSIRSNIASYPLPQGFLPSESGSL